MANKEFHMGAVYSRQVSKKELLEIIDKNFKDDYGKIAVITETRTLCNDETITNQVIVFGKILKH